MFIDFAYEGTMSAEALQRGRPTPSPLPIMQNLGNKGLVGIDRLQNIDSARLAGKILILKSI